jgi:hypothetical protein
MMTVNKIVTLLKIVNIKTLTWLERSESHFHLQALLCCLFAITFKRDIRHATSFGERDKHFIVVVNKSFLVA